MDSIAKEELKRFGVIRTARQERKRTAIPVSLTTPSQTTFSLLPFITKAQAAK